MSQVAVSSVQSRIGGQHSRVIYFEEQDIEPVTDQEIIELCRLAQEQTINLPNAELVDLIDSMGNRAKENVFM